MIQTNRYMQKRSIWMSIFRIEYAMEKNLLYFTQELCLKGVWLDLIVFFYYFFSGHKFFIEIDSTVYASHCVSVFRISHKIEASINHPAVPFRNLLIRFSCSNWTILLHQQSWFHDYDTFGKETGHFTLFRSLSSRVK